MALSGSTMAQVNLISPILTCITIVSPSCLYQMLEIPKISGPRKFKKQPDFTSCPQIVPRRPYFPHPLALCCHCPVSKCHSASVVVTGIVRVNCSAFIVLHKSRAYSHTYSQRGEISLQHRCIFFNSCSASHDNWCTATLWNRIMTAQC